jgi:hypothetical protein
MRDPLWSAVVLARDVDACEALLGGLAVPRHRLHPGVLLLLGEALGGDPMTLDDELRLRVELITDSPADRVWKRIQPRRSSGDSGTARLLRMVREGTEERQRPSDRTDERRLRVS